MILIFKKLKTWVMSSLTVICFVAGCLGGYYMVDHILLTRAYVKGQSMEPTYYEGDKLIFANGLRPQRGDIAVFELDGSPIIKRVIGIPGDTVVINNGDVIVNDVVIKEPYINETDFKGYGLENNTITLQENEYIILGDNRNHSLDSRKKGVFTTDDLMGTVLFHASKSS